MIPSDRYSRDMRNWVHILALLALGWFGTAAASGQVLDWSELPDPAAQNYEDPFRALTPEQFDDVIFALRLRGRLQQGAGSDEERRKWQMLLTETEAALTADEIDVDWLLDQVQAVTQRRDHAGSAGNPDLDGQTVTLMGFAIPAPPDADGQSVVYLVPQSGMCSHLPAPLPNQMIRVRLNVDWTPSHVHQPVRLTGTLSIDPSAQNVMVVDGIMPMRATFLLESDHVETLTVQEEQLNWTQSTKDHFRKANRRKSGGAQTAD